MAPGPGHVALLVPGLAGPPGSSREAAARALAAVLEGLELPALTTVLSRGRAEAGVAGDAPVSLFFHYIGMEPDGDEPLPLAAFSRHADAQDADRGAWLRADPIHLRPDMARLLVFRPEALDLSLEEAFALVSHLDAAGGDTWPFRIQPQTATRWYLELQRVPGIRTVAPSLAHGEDATRYLPTGPDAAEWHAHMNLAQMLLHDAPVNLERRKAGRLPANSLWFWGAGTLPRDRTRLAGRRIYGERAWLNGAARWLGAELGDPLAHRAPGSAGIVCEEAFALPATVSDPLDYRERLEALEARWLVPALAALRAGRVGSVSLHPGGGRAVVLDRRALGRWWSPRAWRRIPLASLMHTVATP